MSNEFMSPAQKAAHLARWVIREITGERPTLSAEHFEALVQACKEACTEAGVDVVTLYQAVVQEDRGLQNLIREFGRWYPDAGAGLRPH